MDRASRVVIVIDDERTVRTALTRLLSAEGYCAQAFASAEEFLEYNRAGRADCLIVDLRLPGLDGLGLQNRLAEELVDVPIIFLSGRGDIPSTVRAMKEGAVDFLTKPVEASDLLSAVALALELGETSAARAIEFQSIISRANTLTPREREVMHLVATGMLNKQIAYDLGTSDKTVKVHRARVMEKMQVSSVAALVRLVDRLADSESRGHHGARAS